MTLLSQKRTTAEALAISTVPPEYGRIFVTESGIVAAVQEGGVVAMPASPPALRTALVEISDTGATTVLTATPVGKVRRIWSREGSLTTLYNGDDVSHDIEWRVGSLVVRSVVGLAAGGNFGPQGLVLNEGETLVVNNGTAINSAPLHVTVVYEEADLEGAPFGGLVQLLETTGPHVIVPPPATGRVRVTHFSRDYVGLASFYNPGSAVNGSLILDGILLEVLAVGSGTTSNPSRAFGMSGLQDLSVEFDTTPDVPGITSVMLWDDYPAAP